VSAAERRSTDAELEAVEREIEGSPAPIKFDARESIATSSPAGDIARLVDGIKAAGVASVVGLSLTLPEFEVPVVRVVATDLEIADAAPNTRRNARRSARQRSAQ
jgi:ribosomal protein S12 methylthiotransferase accessory factor YcaO